MLGLPLVWIAYKHWRYYKANGRRIEEGSEGRVQLSFPMDGRVVEVGPAHPLGTKDDYSGRLYSRPYDVQR